LNIADVDLWLLLAATKQDSKVLPEPLQSQKYDLRKGKTAQGCNALDID
jgi:hypothetical protein